jgi:A/G-specific adenine glycosylase
MSFIESQQLDLFQKTVWDFYQSRGRNFPWRHTDDPYHVLVSEIMLQQTTTERVVSKYSVFIHKFPSLMLLAQSSLHDVLTLWQGLGYNRRARYLHELARLVVREHQGIIPAQPVLLETFPGIGAATAGSICAFAFNMPTVFIETNIRTVFIHTFFSHNAEKIPDCMLFPLIEKTVDHNSPREWYYALMDYGVHLKSTVPNPNRQSAHYTKQSKFQGSDRQIRGVLIRLLTEKKYITRAQLVTFFADGLPRIERILSGLIKERLVQENDGLISIFDNK